MASKQAKKKQVESKLNSLHKALEKAEQKVSQLNRQVESKQLSGDGKTITSQRPKVLISRSEHTYHLSSWKRAKKSIFRKIRKVQRAS